MDTSSTLRPEAHTADHDVIAGDNARIVRPLDGAGTWQVNAFNGSVRRTVTLYDVGEQGRSITSLCG